MKKNPNKTASVQYQGNLIHFADSWMQAYHGGKVYVCVFVRAGARWGDRGEKKKINIVAFVHCECEQCQKPYLN